jgi:hypothetical protein
VSGARKEPTASLTVVQCRSLLSLLNSYPLTSKGYDEVLSAMVELRRVGGGPLCHHGDCREAAVTRSRRGYESCLGHAKD